MGSTINKVTVVLFVWVEEAPDFYEYLKVLERLPMELIQKSGYSRPQFISYGHQRHPQHPCLQFNIPYALYQKLVVNEKTLSERKNK